jgi:hypothetical protein
MKIRIGKWISAILTELLLSKVIMGFDPKNPGTERYFVSLMFVVSYGLLT